MPISCVSVADFNSFCIEICLLILYVPNPAETSFEDFLSNLKSTKYRMFKLSMKLSHLTHEVWGIWSTTNCVTIRRPKQIDEPFRLRR